MGADETAATGAEAAAGGIDLHELRAESISALAVFLFTTITCTPVLCNSSSSLPLYFGFVEGRLKLSAYSYLAPLKAAPAAKPMPPVNAPAIIEFLKR